MIFQTAPSKKTIPLLWIFTLIVSVGLHLELVRQNPNLYLGSGEVVSTESRKKRNSMRVEEVSSARMKNELPKLLDRYGSANEEPVTTSPIDLPDPSTDLLTDSEVNLPDPTLEHVPSEVSAQTPELSESSSDWQPRQEVLAIKEERVSETLEVLPRKLRETKYDRPSAPDISLPGTPPDLDNFEEFPINFQSISSNDAARYSIETNLNLDNPEPVDNFPKPALPPSIAPPNMETSRIERQEEITPFEAVESLLRLETRVYNDPEDPTSRYFKIQLLPNGIDKLPVLPRDIVYLVDCSASMTERKLRLATFGINLSLENLSERDHVNVIAFRDEAEVLSEKGLKANVFGKAKVRTFLSSLHSHGQTDVFASLNALQSLPKDPERPMLSMLVTDGLPTTGVVNSDEIIDSFSRINQGRISMFSMGGGGRVNRLLLDFLSFRNRGSSLVTPRAEDLPGMIIQASEEIRQPVLMNLHYTFTGSQESEVYPESLSHLYLDRPLILIGRVPREEKRIAFQIIGESANGNHDIVYTIDLDEVPEGSASLRQEWAWQALLDRLSKSIVNPDSIVRNEMEALIENFDLVVPAAYR